MVSWTKMIARCTHYVKCFDLDVALYSSKKVFYSTLHLQEQCTFYIIHMYILINILIDLVKTLHKDTGLRIAKKMSLHLNSTASQGMY